MDSEHRPTPISRHGHNTVLGFRRTPGVVRVSPRVSPATPTADTSIDRALARKLT